MKRGCEGEGQPRQCFNAAVRGQAPLLQAPGQATTAVAEASGSPASSAGTKSGDNQALSSGNTTSSYHSLPDVSEEQDQPHSTQGQSAAVEVAGTAAGAANMATGAAAGATAGATATVGAAAHVIDLTGCHAQETGANVPHLGPWQQHQQQPPQQHQQQPPYTTTAHPYPEQQQQQHNQHQRGSGPGPGSRPQLAAGPPGMPPAGSQVAHRDHSSHMTTREAIQQIKRQRLLLQQEEQWRQQQLQQQQGPPQHHHHHGQEQQPGQQRGQQPMQEGHWQQQQWGPQWASQPQMAPLAGQHMIEPGPWQPEPQHQPVWQGPQGPPIQPAAAHMQQQGPGTSGPAQPPAPHVQQQQPVGWLAPGLPATMPGAPPTTRPTHHNPRPAPAGGISMPGAGHPPELHMEYWDTSLHVWEVFPFQKNALDFAAWCNSVTPATVRRAIAGKKVFPTFADRWDHYERCMADSREEQEEQQGRHRERQWRQQGREAAGWWDGGGSTGSAGLGALGQENGGSGQVRSGQPQPGPSGQGRQQAQMMSMGPAAGVLPQGMVAGRPWQPEGAPQAPWPQHQLDPQQWQVERRALQPWQVQRDHQLAAEQQNMPSHDGMWRPADEGMWEQWEATRPHYPLQSSGQQGQGQYSGGHHSTSQQGHGPRSIGQQSTGRNSTGQQGHDQGHQQTTGHQGPVLAPQTTGHQSTSAQGPGQTARPASPGQPQQGQASTQAAPAARVARQSQPWWPSSRPCVRVFSEEYWSKTKDAYTRHFIVTTYKELWRRMLTQDAADRHYYEIITCDQPAHMYFDIEFSREANPGLDGSELVVKLVELVKLLFRDEWGLELDDTCFLELQSRVGLDPPAHRGLDGTAAAATAPAPAAAAAASPAPLAAAAAVPVAAVPIAAAPAAVPAEAAPVVAAPCTRVPGDDHTMQREDPPGPAERALVLPRSLLNSLTQQLTQQPTQPPNQLTQLAQLPAPGSNGSTSTLNSTGGGLQGSSGAANPSLTLGSGTAVNPSLTLEEDVVALAQGLPQPDKFSVHLLVRAPGGWAFPSNLAVGAAVAALRRYESQWSALQVSKGSRPEDGVTSAVDMAVYSRARNFRCVWCCKGGKEAVLRPTRRYMGRYRNNLNNNNTHASSGNIAPSSPAGGVASLGNEQVFLASLVNNVAEGTVLLDCRHLKPPAASEAKSTGQRGGTAPRKPSSEEVSHESVVHPTLDRRITTRWAVPSGDSTIDSYRTELKRVALAAVGFVEQVAAERAGGAAAQVGSVYYGGEGCSVAFGLKGPGSHYCGRVGRNHKSNHVSLVLDMQEGCWCQRCFDKDCADYNSEWRPLPDNVWQDPALQALILVAVPAAPATSPRGQGGVQAGEGGRGGVQAGEHDEGGKGGE